MTWIIGIVGSIAVPLLVGWWFTRDGIGCFSGPGFTPLRSYYDSDGRYIEPYKEWLARRA